MDQVFNLHIACEWIAARLCYFTPYIYCWRVNSLCIPMDQKPVAWLQQNVLDRIACQRLLQIHAHYFCVSICLSAKELRGFQRSVRRDSTCEINCITQMRLAGGYVLARGTYFSSHPDCGCRLEIKSAENADGIKRRQLGCRLWVRQGRGKIEALHAGTKIWRI